jgi:hypothetical protein
MIFSLNFRNSSSASRPGLRFEDFFSKSAFLCSNSLAVGFLGISNILHLPEKQKRPDYAGIPDTRYELRPCTLHNAYLSALGYFSTCSFVTMAIYSRTR